MASKAPRAVSGKVTAVVPAKAGEKKATRELGLTNKAIHASLSVVKSTGGLSGESSNKHYPTAAVRHYAGKVETVPFKYPPHQSGSPKGGHGKEPAGDIDQASSSSKTFKLNPETKTQQKAGTKGAPAK